jgi:hypothetical protein
VTIALKEGSTTGMWKHLRTKHPALYKEAAQKKAEIEAAASRARTSTAEKTKNPSVLEKFASKSKPEFQLESFKGLVIKLFVSQNISFELVEKDEWKELISYLKHDIKLFGADCLKSYIMNEFDSRRKMMIEKTKALVDAGVKFSFAADIWTSPTNIAFLAITCHFIDLDWNLRNM